MKAPAGKIAQFAGHFSKRLERACVVSLVLAMLSQINGYVSMPSYNSVLAGWGLVCAYCRSARAVFGLMGFMALSFLLDIIFLSVWSNGDSAILSRGEDSPAASTTSFSVTMMVFNLIAKLAIMYYSAHLYAVLARSNTSNPYALPSKKDQRRGRGTSHARGEAGESGSPNSDTAFFGGPEGFAGSQSRGESNELRGAFVGSSSRPSSNVPALDLRQRPQGPIRAAPLD